MRDQPAQHVAPDRRSECGHDSGRERALGPLLVRGAGMSSILRASRLISGFRGQGLLLAAEANRRSWEVMSTKRGKRLAGPETAAETSRGTTPQRHAPARHGDNSMRVYDVLRQRIATRQYAPGIRLTEAEIAKEFEISRTPVRQALHRLAVEGLVEVKNGV